MSSFRIVANPNRISLGEEWETSNKFACKGSLVDEQGRKVDSEYEGPRYQMIEKREAPFSTLERIERITRGIFVFIFTLSLGLLSSSVRKLFTESKKKIRFAIPYRLSSLPSQSPLTSQQGAGALPYPPEQRVNLVKLNPNQVFPQRFLQELENSESEESEPEERVDDLFAREFEISKRKLEEGLKIADKTLEEVRQCIKKISQGIRDRSVEFYPSQAGHRIFSLISTPGLIFKMQTQGRGLFRHHQNMIFAETVIRINKLRLLVVPYAKLLRISGHEILVQEKLDFNPQRQEQYLKSRWARKSLLELTEFVCKTHYSGVGWHNNPILNQGDEEGNHRIGLIDLKEMAGREIGLFGDTSGRKGLFGCVNEEQRKMMEAAAKENGVNPGFFEKPGTSEKKGLTEDFSLEQYYRENRISQGNELVRVDEDDLNFSMYPQEEEKLKKTSLELIKVINEKILKSSTQESIENRRSICINTDDPGPFLDGDRLLYRADKNRLGCLGQRVQFFADDQEYAEATFFGCITRKLVDLGAFYSVGHEKHSWFIQA